MHTAILLVGVWWLASLLGAQSAAADAFRDCQSSNPETQIAGCNRLLSMGQIRTNKKEWSKVLNNLGNGYAARGDYDLALNAFQNAIDADPSNPMPYFNRSQRYFERQEYEKALNDVTQAVRLSPREARYHFHQGRALFLLGNYDEAAAAFTRALDNDARHFDARELRISVYHKEGKFAEALADVEILLRQQPTVERFVMRAELRYKMNALDDAIRDYGEAITRRPNAVQYYDARGRIYSELSRHVEAIADFTRAMELNPRNPNYRFSRGLAFANAAKCELAIPDYTSVIELSPRHAGAYNNRGVCYMRGGERDKARDDFLKALEMDPGNELARGNLAIMDAAPTRPVPRPAPSVNFKAIEELLRMPEFAKPIPTPSMPGVIIQEKTTK